MDKRYWYQVWKRARTFKPWYFLLLALVSGCVSVWALRANSFHMATLRNDVFVADKNDGDVTKALQNLEMYVTHHMNTDVSTGPNAPYPPIQLEYSYDRAVRAAGDQATAQNSQIYTDAQHYCEQQDSHDFYGYYRVSCVQAYIQQHSVANTQAVSAALYEFSFASPWWSPDLAGWSIVIFLASLVAAGVTWLMRRAVHLLAS